MRMFFGSAENEFAPPRGQVQNCSVPGIDLRGVAHVARSRHMMFCFSIHPASRIPNAAHAPVEDLSC